MKKYLSYAVLGAAILQIAVAYIFATQGFFNEETTLRLFIQPAGYAFSIWGLIYTFATLYAIYQVIPSNDNQILRSNRAYVLFLFLGSSLWLYASNLSATWLWITVPILLSMGYVAFKAVTVTPIDIRSTHLTSINFFSFQSLIIYAAWTNIAMFVNTGAMFAQYSLLKPGTVWLVLNIVLLLVVFFWVYRQFTILTHSAWYGFIVIWALIGVFVANGEQDGSMFVAYLASILTIPFLVLSVRRIWRISSSYSFTIEKK